MQKQPGVDSVEVASSEHNAETVLRTYDLSKRYGTRTAVNQLNLDIRRGELVGFLGPNGAGKTTSIRMILGLIEPTAGRVELFGRDLARERASLLPRVGALVEMPALYLHLTGRQNLRVFGEVLGGVSRQRIDEVLEIIGLQTRQKDRVRSYSLGMKQRLGLGIALLHNPDLLILDEPANGLDPEGIVEMRDLLRGLTYEGKTVFLSSHLLSEIQQICSRVVIINAGKLVADSTVEELTRKQGDYLVRLERASEALCLLQKQPWGHLARLEGTDQLITSAPGGSGRELYTFLAQAGFVPESLAPVTQDLEQVFFSLINANEGEQAQ
ncbi:ABC transporter ATP-binding protein [Dictyobacter aurantiacus]|uniref:ABC transporter ATP-binding protein n=1 Tax=Dictyobacter aurantiacus TaxID=1936993 RepID=A0A401ZH49_9CHLR|nr:ABC transporter ATP-binding protein [Dictyobacter aurantiacus]GCE06172.1 ABC transporter ATP-binding protein [Dictyobacter aurantiacus]